MKKLIGIALVVVMMSCKDEPSLQKYFVKEEQKEALKLKLRSLGYPLTSDELSGLQKATTTAKSFVSCAIGKMNS
jgi:hypothetical protein